MVLHQAAIPPCSPGQNHLTLAERRRSVQTGCRISEMRAKAEQGAAAAKASGRLGGLHHGVHPHLRSSVAERQAPHGMDEKLRP